MTDYFVDHTISGGNGLSPASAFASLSSIAWAADDVAWIRRTHIECIQHDKQVFATWTITNHGRIASAVGWPDSLDPFFQRRPQAGIDASWDDDLPATDAYSVFGYKFPTLVASNTNANTAAMIGRGMQLVNLHICQIGSAANCMMGVRPLTRDHVFNNVLMTRSYSTYGPDAGNYPQVAQKLIWPCSTTAVAFAGTTIDVDIDHLVIPPQSMLSNGILASVGFARIGVLENQSNSVSFFFGQHNGPTGIEAVINHIERAVGIQPYSGAVNFIAGGNTAPMKHYVDDYFGLGMRVAHGHGKGYAFGCSTTEALWNGKHVVWVEVGSASNPATSKAYLRDNSRYAIYRKYVNVLSGELIRMRVPIYVGSAGADVMSVSGLNFHVALRAAGGRHLFTDVKSGIIPGSADNWSGTFVAAGSAWLLDFSFRPTESGLVPFDVFFPQWTDATSGANKRGYFLVSEPYSV